MENNTFWDKIKKFIKIKTLNKIMPLESRLEKPNITVENTIALRKYLYTFITGNDATFELIEDLATMHIFAEDIRKKKFGYKDIKKFTARPQS